MGILHIQDRGRSASRWLALGASAIAVGVGLAYGWFALTDTSTDSAVASLSPTLRPRSRLEADVPPASRDARSSPRSSQHRAPAIAVASMDADQTSQLAQTYADCRALAERDVQGVIGELEESYAVDPSGELARRTSRTEAGARARCRHVGPNEYRQIEALMSYAAQRGDRHAQLYFMQHELRSLAQRAIADRMDAPAEEDRPTQPSAAARAVVAQVEALASLGHEPAMELLAQDIYAAGLLVPSDPVRAAAWRLVASHRQNEGPLTIEDVLASEQVTALNPTEVQQVLEQAEALRDRCCRIRRH